MSALNRNTRNFDRSGHDDAQIKIVHKGGRTLQIEMLACAVALCLASTVFAGQVVHVDAAATGGNDGTTWASAYRFLQDALLAGDINGDCVVDFKDFCILSLHWREGNNRQYPVPR